VFLRSGRAGAGRSGESHEAATALCAVLFAPQLRCVTLTLNQGGPVRVRPEAATGSLRAMLHRPLARGVKRVNGFAV